MPPSLQIDKAKLKRKFYENSRALHPDFHVDVDTNRQLELLQKASLNNEAYQTLSDFDRTLKYLLELFEKLGPEGQNQIPQAFLMDMMDLNESVMELGMSFQQEAHRDLAARISSEMDQLNQAASALLSAPDVSSYSEGEWERLKEYYLKRRYLFRLKENFDKIEPEL